MRPDSLVSKTAPSKTVTCLFLAFTAFAVFSGALDNLFVNWDDTETIHDNVAIHSLSFENLKKLLLGFSLANWLPLTLLSHAIDYRLYGIHPAGHHLTSILIHAGNTVWVFLLFGAIVSRIRGENDRCFPVWAGGVFAALLFGLHPLRVESVAWVAERKDVLCAFFALPTYLAYLRYASSEAPRSRKRWYAAALGCFILALMSKPMAVTVPAVLLLLDVFPLRRWQNIESLKRLLPEKIPFFILSVICGILTILAQGKYGAILSLGELSGGDRFLNAGSGAMFYLAKTFLPAGLVSYYPMMTGLSVFADWFFPSILLLAAITALCLFKWQKSEPAWLAAWVYYLVALSPVSGIVHVGSQAAADRYAYLPTLSFFLLAGAGAMRALENVRAANIGKPITSLLAAGIAIPVAFALLTAHQIEKWRDSEVFWKHVIKIYSTKVPFAHNNLGQIFFRVNRLDEAEEEFKIAIAANYVPAIGNLGLVYYERNRLDDAERQFRLTLKASPRSSGAHNNLGLVYEKRKMLPEAEAEYKVALELQPESFLAYNNLGILYFRQGKMAEAEAMYKTAEKLSPEHPFVHNNLGELYYRKGLLDEAEEQFKKSLEFDPTLARAYNNLGRIYLDRDNLDAAEAMLKTALQVLPKYADAHDNLGKLYRKKGLQAEADKEFEQVLKLNPNLKAARGNLEAVMENPPIDETVAQARGTQ